MTSAGLRYGGARTRSAVYRPGGTQELRPRSVVMQAVLKESTSGSSNFGRMQELLPHEAIEPTIDKDEIEAALEYQMSPARWTQPRTLAEDQCSYPI